MHTQLQSLTLPAPPPPHAPAPWEAVAAWLDEHLPPEKQTALPQSAHEQQIDAAIAAEVARGDDVAEWWAQQYALELWDGQAELEAAVTLAEHIAFEFAADHLILLLSGTDPGGGHRCLTARPWHWQALNNVSLYLGAPLELLVGREVAVRDLIGRVYDQRMARSQPVLAATTASARDLPESVESVMQELGQRDLLATADKEPVARMVDALLYDATQKRASDVHIHPYREHLKVRYRLDGVLHDCYQLTYQLHEQIVGRVKVLAGMDVAEKRLAQDGRTSVQIGTRQIDLRVSTLPTTCGERVVIRLLEQTAQLKELGELGMPAATESSFRHAIHRSTGLILVTGPTGSGKTTTLYSALAQLDSTAKNILTLEDPVEYRLAGISQTQVADKKGMTFVSGLRHILRQDPDVIMVGEIRDEPTARMVIQSSMTGHLVLSTLHTNSAAGAVARLMDLGIEPFLIGSSLLGVLAQRLVRTSCDQCRNTATVRCAACADTGYRGRTALFEWLHVSQRVRDQIVKGGTAEQLDGLAAAEGMKTLRQQGELLMAQGLTTESELARVLGSHEI